MSDDSGVTQLWLLRYMHPQAGKMFGALVLSVLARPPAPVAGVDFVGQTTVTWTFTCCPEAEAIQTQKGIFAPMLKSMWFPKGGGGQDSDGDGVNDHHDPAPLNPLIR